MVFYVTGVTFLVIGLLNKCTNTMMDDYFNFIHYPKPCLRINFFTSIFFLKETSYFVHPNINGTKKLAWMIENWMKNHSVSDSKCNTVNL